MKGLAWTVFGAALAACALAATPAFAQSGEDIAMQGTKAGALACSACHGAKGEGQPAAAIPRLAGHDAGYLLRQLDSFADGKRKNDIMTPIASALTPAERKAVAAYYAKQKAPQAPEPAKADTATLALGGAIAEGGDWSKGVPGCSQCHGPHGSGVGSLVPRLAGQSAEYIEAQLKAWAAGTRKDDPMGLMAAIAKKLDAKEVSAVAAYYAAYPKVPEPAASHRRRRRSAASPRRRTAPFPNNDFGKMVTAGPQHLQRHPALRRALCRQHAELPNCHLDSGRLAGSAPLWAAYVSYPAYRSKNKHVNSYDERLQGCFRYSMNGKPPALGSKPLLALETYSYFLAKGAPVGADMKGRGYPKLKTAGQTVQLCPRRKRLQGKLRALPWREWRRPEIGRRQTRLPGAVGPQSLQLGRRHGQHQERGRLHQGQHAVQPGHDAVRSGGLGRRRLCRQP